LKVGLGDPKIADRLIISGPRDLLFLVECALHAQPRFSFFKRGSSRSCLFTRYFLLLITRASQKSGAGLTGGIRFCHGSL
jgi:hypothetical protein